MEPRSTVVDPTGEQMTVWSATQVPHILRFLIAATMGIPESKVRVIAPDVGGGFGGKLQTTPEEFATIARRPPPGQALQVHRDPLRVAALGPPRARPVAEADPGRDQGRHGSPVSRSTSSPTWAPTSPSSAAACPVLGAWMFNSIYKFEAYQFNCQTVLTNKTWVDAYRGAGRPEATFAIERIMDELAVEVGVDPLEIREKNWITNTEFPFTTVAGMTYDSGNYEAATEKAKGLFDYDGLRAEQQRRRESKDPVQLGIGISTFTEMCGLAPSRVLGQLSYGAGGWEAASIRMLATGTVEVITGTSPHGQGHETAWSQIVADRLGVPFEDVEVLHGDTQIAPKGIDSYGSRSLVVGGEALVKAADKVIEKAKPIAAHLLEADASDLEFSEGRFTVKGTDKGVGLTEIAMGAWTGHNLPDGIEPTLDSDAVYDPVNFSFPHGTHLCAMEVDTETGQVTMRKYVCVDDIGTIVNPLIVEGQIHGGLVQGIAQALWEGAEYDGNGTLTTGSFVDYTLPTAADTISYVSEHTVSPSTTNTLGTKGVGEAGTIASTPAVVNAIVDALRPLGINDILMPCTPGAGVEGDPVGRGPAGRGPRGRGAAPLRGRRPQPGRPEQRHADEPRELRRPGEWPAMIPAQFDYVAPESLEEALSALAEAGDDAKVLAGGQSLLPVLRMRLNAPEKVVDLRRIPGLTDITEDGDHIVIGSMATHSRGGRQRPGQGARPAAVQDRGGGGRPPDPPPRHGRRGARPRRPGG